jgi:hypothetical protein
MAESAPDTGAVVTTVSVNTTEPVAVWPLVSGMSPVNRQATDRDRQRRRVILAGPLGHIA